jgi:hypothetical protein
MSSFLFKPAVLSSLSLVVGVGGGGWTVGVAPTAKWTAGGRGRG